MLVPSCRECNLLLSDSLQACFLDRLDALKGRLKHKHRKRLAIPDWSEAELSELGDAMRADVLRSLRLCDEIMNRVDFYIGQQAYIDHLESLDQK